MRHLRWSWFVLVVMLAGCSRATPEQQVINDAAAALGGADRLGGVRSLVLTGVGTQYNLGQDVVPGASGQTFTVSAYTRAIDAAGGRARSDLTRQPNFAFFQGPAPQRQVQGIDGDVAYNVAANGTGTRVGGTAADDRRLELLHHPVTALQAALAEGATLATARTEGGQRLVDITTTAGQAITLAIDATTHLPSRVSHRSYHTNLGDVVISTSFADYQSVGGLHLPAQLTMRTDDFTTAEYRLAAQSLDGDTSDLAAPEAARTAPTPAGPPPVTTTADVIAPGIWLIGGGSHHSVLVEFADHLALIEAPQSPARVQAAITRARETVPGKPLTQLVNTHHHFDHTAGIRAAMAEGLTIITHEGNRAFFEEIARRPHTITPDALQASPREVMIEGISDERTLTDGTMTVTLHAISTAHSQTMLVAYVPRDRILVEVDAYTPGAAAQSFSGELLAWIRARNLQVDRIVPLHGQPVPFAQLLKEATPAPASGS